MAAVATIKRPIPTTAASPSKSAPTVQNGHSPPADILLVAVI